MPGVYGLHNCGCSTNNFNDMKTELFKKVYIRSEEDLPKKDGNYIVKDRENYNPHYLPFVVSKAVINLNKDFWLNNIDWYLLPIADEQWQEKLTDEQIEKWADNFDDGYYHEPAILKYMQHGIIMGAIAYQSGKIHEWLNLNKK
jgi:hypothetical protein